jgi:H+-transporting ATPase
VTIVSFVLGLVACLSSLILLVICMQARDTDFIARAVAPMRPVNHATTLPGKHHWSYDCQSGKKVRYVSWGEVQTMIYLKISLSDFFTVFAARCRSWCVSCCRLPDGSVGERCASMRRMCDVGRFFERRPGYALSVALVVATGTSTLFSLVWFFPPDQTKQLNMSGLAHARYAALLVWIYVLLWFIAQDVIKVICYFFLARFRVEEQTELEKRRAMGRIQAAIDGENRADRIRGGTLRSLPHWCCMHS